MNTKACLLVAMTTWSTLAGCVPSLPPKAKLLAASQECGGADGRPQNPELTKRYDECVKWQLDTIDAQEAAYERRQADFLVGLSKAFEPPVR